MAHTLKLAKSGKQVTIDQSIKKGLQIIIKENEPWHFIDHIVNRRDELQKPEQFNDESYENLLLDAIVGNYDDSFDHLELLAALTKMQELVLLNLKQLQ
jgi:hypothetical protein